MWRTKGTDRSFKVDSLALRRFQSKTAKREVDDVDVEGLRRRWMKEVGDDAEVDWTERRMTLVSKEREE